MNRLIKVYFPAAIAILLLISVVPQAFGHAHPKVMSPAPDSAGPAPGSISITFSEAVEPKFSSIKLTDASGKAEGSEAAKATANDAKTLTLTVPKLSPGTYTVHWVSVAVDGHRLDGSYKFTVR